MKWVVSLLFDLWRVPSLLVGICAYFGESKHMHESMFIESYTYMYIHCVYNTVFFNVPRPCSLVDVIFSSSGVYGQ